MPRWYTATPNAAPTSLGVVAYPESDPVPADRGIGLEIPPRKADCTGVRPSWYPFVRNVCDWELDPEDRDLWWREMTTDPAPQ